MEFEHVFSYDAPVKALHVVGAGPYGHRRVAHCGSGTIRGPRLNGEVLEGGHDWVLDGADGWGRVDVRVQFKSDDGAVIYAQYLGVVEQSEKYKLAAASQGETAFEDLYFRSAPRYETGDPRYAWMTQSVFVGRGRFLAGRRVYWEIYRVT